MWIENTETNQMVQLKDCIKISKVETNYSGKKDYGIYFEYSREGFKMFFKTKEERNNFFETLQNSLKPVKIDPEVEPLTL